MLPKVEKTIQEYGLLKKGDRVLAAVSGGLDSMVLLHLLTELQPAWRLTLAVAHFNHMLRGREADRDERFVRDHAAGLGIPFHSVRYDVKGYCERHRVSKEVGSRILRYATLRDVLSRTGSDVLALGHHADDQAETILMNVIRGAGMRGMAGMLPKRGPLIRPLLFICRRDIVTYASSEEIRFVEDSSNRAPVYFRNRIRHHLLNEIEKTAGRSAASNICRAGTIIAEYEYDLQRLADDALKRIRIKKGSREIILDIDRFLKYFKSVQKHVIVTVLKKGFGQPNVHFHDIGNILTLAADACSGSTLSLHGGITVTKSQSTLAFILNPEKPESFFISPGASHIVTSFGIRFTSERIDAGHLWNKGGWVRNVETVDYEKLSLPLSIRSFQQGDWFVPLGMQGRKKIQDFFTDEKIPSYRRERIPLLFSGESLVWVIGYRLDNRFKVTPDSKVLLQMRVTPIGEE